MNGRKSKSAARPGRPSSPPARAVARPAIADWTRGLPVFVPQGYEPGYDYPLLVWLTDPTDASFDLAACTATKFRRLIHAAGAMLAIRIYPGQCDPSRVALGDVNRWLMEEICGPSAGLRAHVAQ